MSIDHTERNGFADKSRDVERRKETLNELNDLLAGSLEATVGERDTEDFHEVYVIPDPAPASGVHLVMILSTEGELFHTATFDVDSLETATAHAKMMDQ